MAIYKTGRIVERNQVDITTATTPTDVVRSVYGPDATGDFIIRAPNGNFRFVSIVPITQLSATDNPDL